MPRSGPRIAVVGSINLDLVARVIRLPRPGETLTDAELSRVPGGKGANQAVAAARLGADVRFTGAVGDDEFGELALAELRNAGVDLTGLQVVPNPTGIALILVDDDGENQIVVVPGANHELDRTRVDVGDAQALICQLEIEDDPIEAAAAQLDGFFCLNAAPARSVSDAILQRADLVVTNSYELDALGSSPLGALFAVTLGPEGALLLDDGQEVARAAPPAVEPVDGTGAGDAFTAALVVSLLEGRDREEALCRACAAGALAASRPGAQPSLPTAVEIDEILTA
ncbi:MAG TPA: ribokinase [Gaiellaceae bacterium]|nr:ribokinase [Gaiellaceae bacterium]